MSSEDAPAAPPPAAGGVRSALAPPPPDAVADRVGPTLRPDRAAIGYMVWHELLFLHWPVAPELVRPLVPEPLELDLWQGTAWVGLVPFRMSGVRPRGWPGGLSWRFLESNVRTYVHLGGRDPGVWFFSLDAESLAGVQAGRAFFALPYHPARMSLTRAPDGEVEYRAERRTGSRPRLRVRYRVGERLGASPPGTAEHFFLERYLLYASRRRRLLQAQVHHQRYDAHRAELIELADGFVGAAGLPAGAARPALAHWAPRVDVEVFAMRPVAQVLR